MEGNVSEVDNIFMTGLLQESRKVCTELFSTQARWKAELSFKGTYMFRKASVAAHQFLTPLTNGLATLGLLALWHWKSPARLLISQQTLAADCRVLAKHAHFGCVSKSNPNILRLFLH